MTEPVPTAARRCDSALRCGCRAWRVPSAARAALQETPVSRERCRRAATCRRSRTACRRSRRSPSWKPSARPGGELRMLMASPKDTRMMVVYGYARLVGYTPVADDSRRTSSRRSTSRTTAVFTLHLRTGPQMVGRAAVHRRGFPLLVRGRRATTDSCRRRACRWRCCRKARGRNSRCWTRRPCATAGRSRTRSSCRQLAGPSPLYIYRPAHYLKQFHQKYADKDGAGRAGKAGEAAQLGGASQQARHACTATTTRICRHSSPGSEDEAAGRPLHVRAQPLLLPGRQAPGISFPTSTESSCRSPTARSSRPRPAPAKAICRRAICASTTTPS